jgi:ribokinase
VSDSEQADLAGRRGLLVIGSVNVDLVVRLDTLPAGGETVLGTDAVLRPGGKGANQAVAAALARADVALAGRVGDDSHADDVRGSLASSGVDIMHLATVPGATTGLAVVLVASNGENSIAVVPGANHRLVPEDLDALRDEIARARVLLLQMELPVDVVTRACRLAAEVGTPVVLNLAPAVDVLPEVLRNLAALVVNRSEAQHLVKTEVTSDTDLMQAAVTLHALGPRTVVVTADVQGAFVAEGEETFHVPALTVDVVDTTGAGDAFVGVLAARISQEVPLEEAVRDATSAAAAAVQVHGAQLSELPGQMLLEHPGRPTSCA